MSSVSTATAYAHRLMDSKATRETRQSKSRLQNTSETLDLIPFTNTRQRIGELTRSRIPGIAVRLQGGD